MNELPGTQHDDKITTFFKTLFPEVISLLLDPFLHDITVLFAEYRSGAEGFKIKIYAHNALKLVERTNTK